MKKKEFFSAALFKENLKRFWPLAATGFFIYFMSGPFILLRSTGVRGSARFFLGYTGVADGFMSMLLAGQNVGFEFVHLVLPVTAAVAVFSYLNKVGSVGMMHSLPFSRRVLFVTNCASGLTLSIVPFIFNWVFALMLKGAVNAAIVGVNYGAYFSWLLAGAAIIVFVFGFAVLACMVSGNSVIATLTGFAFNFLIQAVSACFAGYAAKFLTGYSGEGLWDFIMRVSPWTATLYDKGIDPISCLIYIAAAAVLLVVSDVLYHARKLERCGDSYVFSWMQTVVGFLFVFVISTMTGLVMFEGLGIMAYVIGFIIGFLLGQMITQKTLHIFNRTSLRNLILFAVIMALIIGGFALDILGFQKKVPDAADVKSADVNMHFVVRYDTKTVRSEDAIKAVVGLHQDMVDDLDALRGDDDPDSIFDSNKYYTESVSITYTLNSGRKIYRSYSVPVEMLDKSESYKALISSPEVLENVDDLALIPAEKRYVEVQYYLNKELSVPGSTQPVYTGYKREELAISNTEIDSLLKAYSEDMKDAFRSGTRHLDYVYEIEFCCVFREAETGKLSSDLTDKLTRIAGFSGCDYGRDGEGTITAVYILDTGREFTRTIDLLRAYGIPGPEELM